MIASPIILSTTPELRSTSWITAPNHSDTKPWNSMRGSFSVRLV